MEIFMREMRALFMMVMICAIAGVCLPLPVHGAELFVPTGSMETSRYDHTATLLPNGKLLVAGGYNFDTALTSAELYDPATGKFTATGGMITERSGHTATLLPNGKLLMAGGVKYGISGALSSAELYDPAKGTFTSTGSMGTARSHQTATLLPNGKVLITGGGDLPSKSAELYDPATGLFTSTGNMAGVRACHTATLLPTGKVLVAGGYDAGGSSLSSAELYDPATGLFTPTGDLNGGFGRYSHTATLLITGKVLLAGGADNNSNSVRSVELYDPATGSFTTTGSMTMIRVGHTATLLSTGMVLVTGGNDNFNDTRNSSELYDPSTGTFAFSGNMTARRHWHSATLLSDGRILVAGGYDDSSGMVSSSDLYGHGVNSYAGVNLPKPVTSSAPVTSTITVPPGGCAIADLYVRLGVNHPSIQDLEIRLTHNQSGRSALLQSHSCAGVNISTLYEDQAGSLCPPGATTHPAEPLSIFNGLAASGDWVLELHDTGAGSGGSLTSWGIVYSCVVPVNVRTELVGGSFTVDGALYSSPQSFTWKQWSSHTLATTSPQTGGDGTRYVFMGWSDGGALTHAVTVPKSPMTYTATFAANPGTVQRFIPTGSMGGARYYHTATLLPTGTVLMGGGDDDTSITLSSSELYDPATMSFIPGGSMVAARSSYTATLLPDGKLLMAGGYNNSTGILSSSELYDSATGNFILTGEMMTGRTRHTATLLPSGKVLMAGGENSSIGTLSSAELYDPATGLFTSAGDMTALRADQSATLLFDGKVLLAGGGSADLYDPEMGTFTPTGSMKTARYSHTATLLPSGKVLISGGYDNSSNMMNSAELYDPVMGSFDFTGSMVEAHALHTATLLPTGKVLIVGGGSAELYDPATGIFSQNGGTTTVRFGHTATLLHDGNLLVAGGYGYDLTNYVSLSSAELYAAPLPGVPITIQTTPPGRGVTVDGVSYSSPQTFTWDQGSSHLIGTSTPQDGGAGIRQIYTGWSDGGGISHQITVTATPATYTATFTPQYLLTTTAGAGGSVFPLTGNWYDGGSVINIFATANDGYTFDFWSGLVANRVSAGTTVSMSQPLSVTASFIPIDRARIGTALYQDIFAALSAAAQNDLIEAQGVIFTGGMRVDKGFAVRLKGGVDSGFNTIPGGMTTIQGTLTIVTGSLAVDRLTLR